MSMNGLKKILASLYVFMRLRDLLAIEPRNRVEDSCMNMDRLAPLVESASLAAQILPLPHLCVFQKYAVSGTSVLAPSKKN